MKKVLIILIPTIVVLLMLTQIDDDLSKEAKDLIDRIETDRDSDSYLYLSGIFANEKDNPISIGKKILEESRRAESDASYDLVGYEDSKKIQLPRGDAFCKMWNDPCLKYLFSSEIDIKNLLDEHKVLVSRSNTFLEFEEYTTLTKPAPDEQLLPYEFIVAAERIKTLNAISAYNAGNSEKAIESLLLQFSKLRGALELQDDVPGKLIFLNRLSEIIDVVSIILTRENTEVGVIPSLTLPEKSIYMEVARGFGAYYYNLKNLDRNPEIFEMGGNLPGWIVRMIFKPNMTLNGIASKYYRYEHLSKLSPSDFAAEIEKGNNIIFPTSKFRNYVGELLISLSPNYEDYLAKFKDFDAKLVLFNHKYLSGNALVDVENPYYSRESYKEVNQRICFDGPLEDTNFLRCLRVTI